MGISAAYVPCPAVTFSESFFYSVICDVAQLIRCEIIFV